MEWNWSTFVLEMINFLVLVWILKHFFYRPVLGVIERRQKSIDQTVEEANRRQSEAEALLEKYERRLQDWEQEKQKNYDRLREEINNERSRRLQELEVFLEQKKQQSLIADQKQLQAKLGRLEKKALEHAAGFARKLLEFAAGAEMQDRLLDLIINDLKHLSSRRIEQLKAGMDGAGHKIMVYSAFPLSVPQQQLLQETLSSILVAGPAFQFEQDEALLCGLRISLGSWVLGLNLQDELKGFVELAHES